MSAYLIWNPWVGNTDPATIELVVTAADSDQISDGTDKFIAGLLRDLGIKAKPTKWSLTACRSTYYSEYLDSEDWRDRWQVAWKVVVGLKTAPKELPVPPSGWIPTNSTDSSWTFEKSHLNLTSARCLVVADFRSEAALDKAHQSIAALKLKPAVRVGHSRALGRYTQLHADLGDQPNSFFERGAETAERVASLCEKAGGLTNHLRTLKDRDIAKQRV